MLGKDNSTQLHDQSPIQMIKIFTETETYVLWPDHQNAIVANSANFRNNILNVLATEFYFWTNHHRRIQNKRATNVHRAKTASNIRVCGVCLQKR